MIHCRSSLAQPFLVIWAWDWKYNALQFNSTVCFYFDYETEALGGTHADKERTYKLHKEEAGTA